MTPDNAGYRIWLFIAAAFFGAAILAATIYLRLQPPVIEDIAVPSASPSAPPQTLSKDATVTSPNGPKHPPKFTNEISALGRGFGGSVGITVQSLDDGWVTAFNGDQKFPQQSVSKLWVAASVMDRVDAGEIKLTDGIALTASDLTIFHQPIRKRIGGGSYRATIDELLNFAMTQSDNTANDVLFRKVGGKAGVEEFFAKKQLPGITMSEGEKELQMQIAGMQWDDRFSYGRFFWQVREGVPFDIRVRAITQYTENPADGATPVAIAMGLAKLHKRELVSAQSSAYLIDLMNQSKTGPDRLRGGLAPGWQIAHKTGTGQVLKQLATAYNDVGILSSPTGRHYAVAVMIGATNRSVQDRQALMHNVVQAITACETQGWSSC